MSLEAARIFVTVGANTGPFAKGMAGATAGVNGFAAKTQTKLGATGGFIKKWGAKAAVGVAAVGIAAGAMSMSFEDSMTDIRGLVGASDRQMAMYEKGVLGMAKTLPQGPKALADALYFVTSSGFKGAAALDVLKQSAKASAAGLGSTATVADAVTSAVNAWGKGALSATRATDILLAAVREGKVEPEELAGSIGRVTGQASEMGVEFEEVAGTLAALSLVGVDAAEGVTSLRGILGTIIKPSKEARKFLKKTGESIGGIRKELKEKGLLPTITRLAKKFKGNQDAIGKLFPNVRALAGFYNLTGKNAKKTAGAMDGVASSAGDTDTAFKVAMQSSSNKVKKAWSSIQADITKAGDSIGPALAGVASAGARFVTFLSDGSTGAKILMGAVGSLAALLIVGAGAIKVYEGAMAAAKIATGAWAAIQWVLNAALAANPILLIILGLVALGVALVVAYQKSETFRRIVHGALSAVKGAAQRVADFFKGPFVDFIKSAFATVKGAVNKVRTAFATAWDAIKNGVLTAVDFILGGFDLYLLGLSKLLHAMGKMPGPMGAPFRKAAEAVDFARGKVGDLRGEIQSLKGKSVDVKANVYGLAAVLQLGGAIDRIEGRRAEIGAALSGSRAMGGPVSRGHAYLVGERGPELFTPGRTGRVHNARESMKVAASRMAVALTPAPARAEPVAAGSSRGGGGGLTVNFNGPILGGDEDRLAQEIYRLVRQGERRHGNRNAGG